MDTTPHSFTMLFAQLGLDNSRSDIQHFLENHKLARNVPIQDAPFWNKAQRAFIQESLEQDSDWSEMIDELSIRIRD